MNHPPREDLLLFARGSLGGDGLLTLTAHLANCAPCRNAGLSLADDAPEEHFSDVVERLTALVDVAGAASESIDQELRDSETTIQVLRLGGASEELEFALALILFSQAWLAPDGQLKEARKKTARARETFRRLGDDFEVGRTWLAEARLAIRAGETAAAMRAAEEAARIFEGHGDEQRVQMAHALLQRCVVDTADANAADPSAAALLAPFLPWPTTSDWKEITSHERFRTAAVAVRLIAEAHSICDKTPLEGLKFADGAIAIAEGLPNESLGAQTACDLRGTAWRERANALRLLGRFAEALESLTRAESWYERSPSDGLGRCIVKYIRATVLYEQGRLVEAAALAEDVEAAYTRRGDEERRMNALYLRACIRFESYDLESARDLFSRVLSYGETTRDELWIARAAAALGNCEIERGNLELASGHFHRALAIFREARQSAECIRAEWGIACVFLRGGNHEEAIRRLGAVSTAFEDAGMVTDGALAGLDLADALLAAGRADQIVDLTSRLFRVFANAGMLTGALTAMSYLREAAHRSTLTPAAVQLVRTFLRRAQRDPDFLFVPPA